MTLFGFSFHSLRGGVGKSRRALQTARLAAERDAGEPVYLIETELAGTSLADSGLLRAPRWDGDPLITSALLHDARPTGFHDEARTRTLPAKREATAHGKPSSVPFLNDFLLYETQNWDEEHDAQVDGLCWRHDGAPPNLRIIPASPLPRDVLVMQMLINDEQHSAFIEGRLERLLAYIVKRHDGRDVTVVFDCERGLRGVGGAVLSLGLRLSSEPKQPLAVGGDFPHPLAEMDVSWMAYLLVSRDIQDRAAADRWMALMQADERKRVRLVASEPQRTGTLAARLRPDAPTRSVIDVGPGDYVKVDGTWMEIGSNSAEGADYVPRHWTVCTIDGGVYGMFGIDRYAKATDLER